MPCPLYYIWVKSAHFMGNMPLFWLIGYRIRWVFSSTILVWDCIWVFMLLRMISYICIYVYIYNKSNHIIIHYQLTNNRKKMQIFVGIGFYGMKWALWNVSDVDWWFGYLASIGQSVIFVKWHNFNRNVIYSYPNNKYTVKCQDSPNTKNTV